MEKERDFSLGRLVFKIILVIAFVFLLMWLFPMPNLNPVYDRIFADNIDTMKDAAKSYYTVDRLPKEVNASVSMTLSEMLAKKFVLPIADSDGKICDGDASYVQITKTDQPNEYILKANLVCPNKADYVIEYMGCYDLCPATCKELEPVKEENKVTPQKTEYVTRYQLQRTWYRGTRQNTGPSYTEYKHERYENVEEFDRYVCSEGVLVGSTCRITDNSTTTQTAAPIASTTSSTTTQTAAPIANTTSSSNTTYSCPTGYTASGSGASMTCSRQVTTSNTKYSCPTGYTASGSGASMTCSRQVSTSSVRIIAAKRIMRTVRVLRDVIWTRNVSEPGYVMVEQRIIPGGTTTVDSGWVLSLPAGYRQTDTKVEYKWSSNKTQAGWTFTGKTTTVKK